MKRIKLFTLISIFCILIMVPTSFAADDAAMAVGETVEHLTFADSSDILSADYYFDANAPDDSGSGSASNPYKEFKSDRVVADSNLHLAKGEYTLDRSVSIRNVTIIGEDPSQTIIKYNYGTGFSVSSSLTLKNLTLVNLRISNNGNFTAADTIFKDYQYGSYNGGVIESQMASANTVLNHCIFNNTFAKHGGAIYLNQASLTVTDSLFVNSRSTSYGGTIVAENKARINIADSKFMNSYSVEDAGGAFYLMSKSNLYADNLEINNCSATFGGAIVSLQSNLDLNRFTARNNRAKHDGGAIYSLYEGVRTSFQRAGFYLDNSIFENNSAENAGAVFVYNIDALIIKYTQFIENHALNTAGAYYSAYLQEPYYESILDEALHNTFSNNKARTNNDVLESDLPEVFIGSGDFILIKANASDIKNIPGRYDLRELNQVTAVRDQGNDGNCWAFSTLGALESSIKKATGIEFDFSEENMKNLMGLYSPYGWNLETNDGGYDRMGYAYLIGWLGPVDESDDKYKRDSVLSPVLNSLVHVQNMLLFKRENYTDNDAIKLAIMKYGGVSTSLYSNNQKDQYYTGSATSNHAAVIVGWDDNLEFSGAPGKGGWIVKNSWGSNWGYNGYFHVSYYDTKFAEPGKISSYVFVLNDTIKYDKNYQYDIPGRTDYLYNSSDVVWYKNRFKATDNEYLAAVSTYFEKDTNWDVSIYVNDKLKLTQSGFSGPSYKTIELDQVIPLAKGDVFEVEFRINSSSNAAVPISESLGKGSETGASLNTKFYSEGISYISYDGRKWDDLYDFDFTYSTHYYKSQVACIKAFTFLIKEKSSIELKVISNYNPVEIEAIVKDSHGNLINSGKVTFNAEDKSVSVLVENGIANFTYPFDSDGTKTVTAKFTDKKYADSSASIKVIVKRSPSKITANDVTAVYNSGESLVATLTDENGNAIRDGQVKIVLGDVTKILTTDKRGKVSLSTKGIVPNTYTAKIDFLGNNIYYSSSTASKVTITKMDTGLSADGLTVTLKGADGNPIAGAKVNVKISNVYSILTTDGDGKATISTLDLDPDTYTANIAFEGNNMYNPSSTTTTIVVDKYSSALTSSDVTTVYNGGKSLVATLKDGKGNAIKGANVTVKLAGISRTLITDSDGQVSLSTDNIVPDSYIADISFSGDMKHYASSTTARVTVNKVRTSLTADDVVTVYNDGKSLTATLKDGDGKAISKVDVTVKLGDVVKTLTTDSKGSVSLSTDGLVPDVYMANIDFAGNNIYYASATTARVTVNKVSTSLSAPDVGCDYDSGRDIAATLTDQRGNALKDVEVRINIAGNTHKLTTDDNGQVFLTTDGLIPDTYFATVTFLGNDIYNPSSATAEVTINKLNTALTAGDVTTYYNEGKKLVATLKGADGKAIEGAKVTVRLGGSTETATTDSNGLASFSTYGFEPNNYTVFITFDGDDIYKNAFASAKVTVLKKVQSKIFLRNALYFVTETKMVKVTLWDENNKPLAGKTVHIKAYDSVWSGVTDENGDALIRVGIGFGDHPATVSFDGDSQYDASDRSGFIRVIKQTPSVMVRGADTQFKASDNNKIVKVHLRDRYNLALPVGSKIVIKLNGQTYIGTTDIDGVAHIRISINYAGTFYAQVMFGGNTAYNAVTREVKFRITP